VSTVVPQTWSARLALSGLRLWCLAFNCFGLELLSYDTRLHPPNSKERFDRARRLGLDPPETVNGIFLAFPKLAVTKSSIAWQGLVQAKVRLLGPSYLLKPDGYDACSTRSNATVQ
jgi:hypothetical protein